VPDYPPNAYQYEQRKGGHEAPEEPVPGVKDLRKIAQLLNEAVAPVEDFLVSL
jgi:hypothetical protein